LVTVAPEEQGAMEFIMALKEEVKISLAHTGADYDTAMKAYSHGAKHLTHMYNAMPPFTHRAPGVIGAAFDTPKCEVELICDGIHVHPSVIRATFQMFGDDRIIMISDSMMAAGMPEGEYMLGGQLVKVCEKRAELVSDGTIAGSVTNLMDCLRYVVKQVGIPFESAIKCASVNPVKSIGLYSQYGSISIGKIANIVLLDKDLNISKVILRGKIVS
jgi:N-acetylglucosamine-6-phosphate deacetylase